jgi:hypothetical protein
VQPLELQRFARGDVAVPVNGGDVLEVAGITEIGAPSRHPPVRNRHTRHIALFMRVCGHFRNRHKGACVAVRFGLFSAQRCGLWRCGGF